MLYARRLTRLLAFVLTLIIAAASAAQGQPGPASPPTGFTGWVQGYIEKLNDLLGDTVSLMADVLFADFGTGVPLIIIVLVAGGFALQPHCFRHHLHPRL